MNLQTQQNRSIFAEIRSGENSKMASLTWLSGTLPQGYKGRSEKMRLCQTLLRLYTSFMIQELVGLGACLIISLVFSMM